jgi:hypothetical protein
MRITQKRFRFAGRHSYWEGEATALNIFDSRFQLGKGQIGVLKPRPKLGWADSER